MQDCQDIINNRDPLLTPGDLALWQDSIPVKMVVQNSADEIDILSSTAENLKSEVLQAEFEADCLRLARDAALFGQLLNAQKRHTRAQRSALLLHLREQNQFGANLINDWMRKNCKHVLGPLDKADPHVSSFDLKGNVLVWCDFTKCGRVSQHFLNSSVDFIRRMLVRDPVATAAFIVCPVLTSEKCATLRAEQRSRPLTVINNNDT